jgi:glutamine cyclotransferase
LSDGTSRLRFIDPVTFEEIGSYTVRDGSSPVTNLNELEYIRGEIYANVWQTDRLVVIAPATGQVTGWVDFTGLLADADKSASVDAVLNGIAYDELGDRLFVTGKLWPKLFEVKLVRR